MGITNFGDQQITFSYKTPGKSKNFNHLLKDLFPVGIYKGANLTKIDTVTVQISQLTCFIEDTINDVGVKIATRATINTTVAPSTPYLIIRMSWNNIENNYADIIAVDYASIDPKDIIIGRCVYDSSNNLQSTFDYTRRTVSSLQDLDDKHINLKVLPTEPITNTVSALAGDVLILNNPYSFAGATSDAISDTVDGRIDIVYIDDSGDLKILEGSDNASPVQPDFPSRGLAIAKITRTGGVHTVVRGDQIEQLEYDGVVGRSVVKSQTASEWTSNNPILALGEWGLETDTGNVKMGDGSTAWNDLAYQHQSPYVQEITSSGSIVFKKTDNEIKVDLSLGNLAIDQLPTPDFIGQKVHIYGVGSGIGSIASGTGLYANGVYFTENTGGVFLTAISLTEWRAENGVTADYMSGTNHLLLSVNGIMETYRNLPGGVTTDAASAYVWVLSVNFANTNYVYSGGSELGYGHGLRSSSSLSQIAVRAPIVSGATGDLSERAKGKY